MPLIDPASAAIICNGVTTQDDQTTHDFSTAGECVCIESNHPYTDSEAGTWKFTTSSQGTNIVTYTIQFSSEFDVSAKKSCLLMPIYFCNSVLEESLHCRILLH